jgi:transcriptional regulator with XRE-family HTH domain
MPSKSKRVMLTREECGRRLQEARKARGLTQADAAELLGIARNSYAQYENGSRVPTWTRLDEMIFKLGLDPKIVWPELTPQTVK